MTQVYSLCKALRLGDTGSPGACWRGSSWTNRAEREEKAYYISYCQYHHVVHVDTHCGTCTPSSMICHGNMDKIHTSTICHFIIHN